MKKLLRPGDILLLGLAGAADIYEEIKDPLGVGATAAKNLYGWVPKRFRRNNFSRLVLRQIRTGDIEKRVIGDGVFLHLTSSGQGKIVRDFPVLKFQKQKWDHKWRVVIFDIKEIHKYERDRLRDKLKELGFGMLQESVWVTPHDIGRDMREFLEERNLGATVFVLEMVDFLAGDRDLLVQKIWKLADLNDSYQKVVEEVKVFLSEVYIELSGRLELPTAYFKKKMLERAGKIRQGYLLVQLADPCLPKELLPKNWAGGKAEEAVRRLRVVDKWI